MKRSLFKVQKMDCPSEENLIRLHLQDNPGVKKLEFDIPKRELLVYHSNGLDLIEKSLKELNLSSTRISTEESELEIFSQEKGQRKLLWMVLGINLLFFIIEMTTGLISDSMGLVADSLDMLADSIVYGVSLIAVGGTVVKKKKIARLAGYFQIALAVIGFSEVLRRFFGKETMPDFETMIVVSIFALIANALSLYLLQKGKSREAHIKASMIFTSNDIIINTGVILAGLLVNYLDSSKPDLIIGAIVFIIVIQGALRILRVGRQ